MSKTNAFGLSTKTSNKPEIVPAKSQLITHKKMLLEKRADEVLEKMISSALNEDSPSHSMALKWCGDRMLPMSEFEDEGKKGGIKTVIIDRSCGGKVIVKTGGGSVEIGEEEFEGNLIENGE